jgi:hypothetical protein
MSLNDEAVEDLDVDVVKEPGEEPGENPAQSTIEVIVSPNSTGETSEERAAISDLDENHVLLQTVEKGVTRVHDMEDVVTTVLSEESISRTTARTLAACFEDFTEAVAKPIEFTERPTATNLKVTQAFIKTRYTEEKEKLVDSFSKYLHSTLGSIKCVVGEIENKLLPEALVTLEALRVQALADLASVPLSKAFYIYNKEKALTDLRARPINYVIEKEEFPDSDLSLFPSNALTRALQTEVSNPIIRNLLRLNELQLNDPRRLVRMFRTEGEYSVLTYQKLLSVYAGGSFLTVFTTVGEFYKSEAQRVLGLLEKDLSEGQTYTFEEVQEAIEPLSDFVNEIALFHNVLLSTRTFFMLSGELLSHYRKLL